MVNKKKLGIMTALLVCVLILIQSTSLSNAIEAITLTGNTYICGDENHISIVQGDSDPVEIFSAASLNSGSTVSFSEGYVDIKVEEGSSSYDKLSVSPGAYANGLTVDDNLNILSAQGTTIGSIDSTYDGSNGWLRVNFLSPMPNGGFDNGEGNWNIVKNVCPYVSNSSHTGVNNYNAYIKNDGGSHGNYLYMELSGNTSSYGSVHGPYAESSTFSAGVGDTIKFDWKARRTGDNYDVYAYLDDDGKRTQLLYVRGSGTTDWATKSIPLTSDYFKNASNSSNLKFIFICGSYDASGGCYIGTNFSIDNARVSNTLVTGSEVEDVLEIVGYKSTDNNLEPGKKDVFVTAYTPVTSTTYTGAGEVHFLSVKQGDSSDPTNGTVLGTATYSGNAMSVISDEIVTARADKLDDSTYSATVSEYGVTLGTPEYDVLYKAPGTDEYVAFQSVIGADNINIVNAGNYKIIGKLPYLLDETAFSKRSYTYYLNVEQDTPVYTVPSARSIVYGSTLSDIALPTGFTWEKALNTNVGSAGEKTFEVTYTPVDTVNYKCVNDIPVTVNVSKAELSITANDNSIIFGNSPDNNGVTCNGFVNGDDLNDLNGSLIYDYSYIRYGDIGNGYTITPKGQTSDNYNITYHDGTLVVNRKPLNVSMVTGINTGYLYTGASILPEPNVSDGEIMKPLDYAVSYGNNLNVSEGGRVTVTATDAGNYTGSINVYFDIAPIKVTVPSANTGLVYDGSILTGVDDAELFSILNEKNKNAGTYQATAILDDKDNYVWDLDVDSTDDQRISYTIEPKTINTTWSDLELVYTGGTLNPTATVETGVDGDEIKLLVEGDKINVGDYIATSKMETVDTNYTLGNTTAQFSITKAPNTWILEPGIEDWVYKNTESTPFGTSKFGEVHFSYSESETGPYVDNYPTAAGEYWLKAEVIGTDNYEGITSLSEFRIIKETVIAPTVNTKAKVYNGLNQSLDIEEGLRYTISNNSRKDVGTTLAVISLNDPDNYMWDDKVSSDKHFELEIIPANLMITARDKEIVYGDEPANSGVIYQGFVNGETEAVLSGSLTYSYDYVRLGKVGSGYSILPSGLNSNNYDITYDSGNLNVTKRPIDNIIVTGIEVSYVYTGEGINPVPKLSDGDMLKTLDYSLSYGDNTNVLTGGTIIISATDTGDYEGSVEVQFNIAPKPISVPKAITGLVYNGEIQRGVVDGFLYDVTNGTAKAVGQYVSKLTLTDKNNYVWNLGVDSAIDRYLTWEIEANKNIKPEANVTKNSFVMNEEALGEQEKKVAEGIIQNLQAAQVSPLGLEKAALSSNDGLNEDDKLMDQSISYLVKLNVSLKDVNIIDESEGNKTYIVKYTVYPMQSVAGTNEWKVITSLEYSQLGNDKSNGKITFRLPLPSDVPKGMKYVRVTHSSKDGEIIDINTYPILTDSEGREYIEVTTYSFSEFTLEFVEGAEYHLEVVNGEISLDDIGMQPYSKDVEITIIADEVDGKKFDRWVCDNGDVIIADENADTTTITGLTSDTVIKAEYKDIFPYWFLLVLIILILAFVGYRKFK